MCCFFSRWALKWLRTWKTAWTGTSSTCCQPFVRSAGRAFGVSWWSRGWRYPSTWRCTHLPSAGFCSASPTEPQRYRKTQDSLYELLLLMVLFYTSLCYISIIASADRNDGEMQEAGKQVSVFTNIKVKSPKNSKTDVWQRDLMCDFFFVLCFSHSALLLNSVMRAFRPEFVAARATDFIGMIKDCDETGFPKVSWKMKINPTVLIGWTEL